MTLVLHRTNVRHGGDGTMLTPQSGTGQQPNGKIWNWLCRFEPILSIYAVVHIH
jgi:hypothetical protein